MRKIIFFTTICLLLFSNACSSGGAVDEATQNKDYEQLKVAMEKTTKERNEDGSLKPENMTAMIQQTSQILKKYPGDNRTRDNCFHVAEILKVGKDFENAAKFYGRMIELFPKNDMVGNAQFQLAMMQYQKMNDKKGAMANFEAFIRDYPNHYASNVATQFLYELRNGE